MNFNWPKFLKYIRNAGIVGGAVVLFAAIASVLGGVGIIYGLFVAPNLEYDRLRFLITAMVEVDGELKSGSSVYEVSYNHLESGSPGLGSPINGARGAMPVIDLGEHGILAISYDYNDRRISGSKVFSNPPKCQSTSPSHFPTDVMLNPESEYDNFRSKLKDTINNEKNITKFYSLTTRLYSKRLDERFYRTFNFCDLGIGTKKTILPIGLSIEHTDLPLKVKDDFPKNLRTYVDSTIDFLP